MEDPELAMVNCTEINGGPMVLLATAQVRLLGSQENHIEVRALLDQGSEVSLITETMVQLLNLPRIRTCLPISGIGASRVYTVRSRTRITVQSVYNSSYCVEVDALIMPRLSHRLPSFEMTNIDWTSLLKNQLADPLFYQPAAVNIILGADVYGQVLCPGLKRLAQPNLVAQNTNFGWVISGQVKGGTSWRAARSLTTVNPTIYLIEGNDLSVILQKFWELEQIPMTMQHLSPSEQRCKDYYVKTKYRTSAGRYVVRLPFASAPPLASKETRQLALGSLRSMERRFSRDPQLSTAYREFMQSYKDLNHMEEVPTAELDAPGAWYLPHHAVSKLVSGQLKVRVVFDASRQTFRQDSLNKYLLGGPTLQKDLALVLTNWRHYQIAFTADIIKMFRQILVCPQDQDYQRILRRFSPEDEPAEYCLKTVTYGTACAPFLALRTLGQLVLDEGDRFPLGASCLQSCTYVDDMFAGADDLMSTVNMRNELINLLRAGGFELDKWAATHSRLVSDIRTTGSRGNGHKLIEPEEWVGALALTWRTKEDSLGFNVIPSELSTPSPIKRVVLSNISRIFDPLGYLTPVTIILKILLQDLWIHKIGWDDPLPMELAQRWKNCSQLWASLATITIPRWLGGSSKSRCELHGFSDASKRVYAAVIYLRVNRDDGRGQVAFLMAKTKVAPVKTISIPNLELCEAALLVRLYRYLGKLETLKDLPTYAWMDSQVVLSWLRQHPSAWKTFVANRVSFIQTELPAAVWNYVPTNSNPADLATRGISPMELKASALWTRGPDWLALNSTSWPKSNTPTEIVAGAQSLVAQTMSDQIEVTPKTEDLLTRFSSLTKLVRVTAYCLRFIANCRKQRAGGPRNTDFLSASELATARTAIIRLTQAASYVKEIDRLKRGKSLSINSSIKKLNPYLDEDELLRLGGRLDHSQLSVTMKHPPILPKRAHVSRLFVEHAYLTALHGGPTLTLSVLRTQVWVTGGLALVKAYIRRCVRCQRFQPRLGSQLMGNLPTDRVVPPERVFSVIGLDFAGPIMLRTTKGRGHRAYKGYISVFICFASKAIHLEAVSDLSSASFIAAYRRFTGRRGIPRKIYSDRGTNFQGAAKELADMFKSASQFYKDVAAELANRGTTWTFIPPNSPHFGGLWEAGVRSTKSHLLRVLNGHTLTFEELSTVLTEIEACLNSRPLCPLTNDTNDLQALTSAHLIHGGTSALLSEPELPLVPLNRLTRYQLMQRMKHDYWKRWSSEYLHHLQERCKWRDITQNFAVGQLVAIKDNRYPPGKWPLDRIIEVHPGPDGLVRVVTLKTATTTLQRPIVRLSPLLLPSSE